jgi:microcystin-dependent protein
MAFPTANKITAGDTGRINQINDIIDDLEDLEDRKVEGIPGQITAYGGDAAPTGWFLCDGQAVSRVTYADLFTAISTKYGVGDGSTTFNVPNLKGKIPVGLDSAITDFNDRGKTGGSKTHTLTTAEMPAHTHGGVTALSGSGAGKGAGIVTGDTSGSTGGGTAHENMPPYLIVNYIIRY